VELAQRFSTIRHADRFVVMQAGRIVDSGTHEELLARPGPFQRLAQLQSLWADDLRVVELNR
jgi:ABC-type multidrug transport system fused ATPase/permease subunit